jgi:glycine hydroxymethyltransferase
MEKVLECVSMTTNKNSIVGDTSALNPGGIRLGTPALTTRGFQTSDFQYVAELLHEGYEIAMTIEQLAQQQQSSSSSSSAVMSLISSMSSATTSTKKVTYQEFVSVMEGNNAIQQRIRELKNTVETFASQFPMP